MNPEIEPWSHRRDFGRSIIRAGRQWRTALDRELQKFGLTSATWRPLFYLGELGEGVRAKDLAEALGVEPPSVVALLDRLERDGFVSRVPGIQDRRSKVLRMTDKGRDAYARTVEVAGGVGDRLMAGVSDRDLAVCMSVFAQIGEAAAAIAGDGETP